MVPSASAGNEAESTWSPPPPSRSARPPRIETPPTPTPPLPLPDADSALDPAIAFVAAEAVRQAQRGASVEDGAHEVLRWASRRRAVIELALAQLRLDDELDAATQDAASAILERVLTVGLLF
jgi:hypothetical protein